MQNFEHILYWHYNILCHYVGTGLLYLLNKIKTNLNKYEY